MPIIDSYINVNATFPENASVTEIIEAFFANFPEVTLANVPSILDVLFFELHLDGEENISQTQLICSALSLLQRTVVDEIVSYILINDRGNDEGAEEFEKRTQSDTALLKRNKDHLDALHSVEFVLSPFIYGMSVQKILSHPRDGKE